MSQSRNKKTVRNSKSLSFAATSAILLSTAVYPLSTPWLANAEPPLVESSPISEANPQSADSVTHSDVTFLHKHSVIDSISSWGVSFVPHVKNEGYFGASHDYIDMTMTVSLPYDAALSKGSAFTLELAPGYMFALPHGGFSIHDGDDKNTSVARIVTSDDKAVNFFSDPGRYDSDKSPAGARVRVGFVLDKDFKQQPGVVNNITFTIPVVADPTFTSPHPVTKKLYVKTAFADPVEDQFFYPSSLTNTQQHTVTTSRNSELSQAPSLAIKSYGTDPVASSTPIAGRHGFMNSASDVQGANSFVSSQFIYNQAYFVRSDTPSAYRTDGFAAVYSPAASSMKLTPGDDNNAFNLDDAYVLFHDASGLLGKGDMFGLTRVSSSAKKVKVSSSGQAIASDGMVTLKPSKSSLAFVYGLQLDKSFSARDKSINFVKNDTPLSRTEEGRYNEGTFNRAPVLVASGMATQVDYRPDLDINVVFDESGFKKEQESKSSSVHFGLSRISLSNTSSRTIDGAIDLEINGHKYTIADNTIRLSPSEVKTFEATDPRFRLLFDHINSDLHYDKPGTHVVDTKVILTYDKDKKEEFHHENYVVVAAPGRLQSLTLADMLPANPYGVSYLPLITGQDKHGNLASEFSLKPFSSNPVLKQLSNDYTKPVSCSHSDRVASSAVFAIKNDCSVVYSLGFDDNVKTLPQDISSSVRLNATFDDDSVYKALGVPGLAQFNINYYDNNSDIEEDSDSALTYDSGQIVRITPKIDVNYLGASIENVTHNKPIIRYSIANQSDVPWAKVSSHGDLVIDTHFNNDTVYNDNLVKKPHVVTIVAEALTNVDDGLRGHYTIATSKTTIPVAIKINAKDKDTHPLPSFGSVSQYFVPAFVENNGLSARFTTNPIVHSPDATLSLDPSVPSWVSLEDGDKLSIDISRQNYQSKNFVNKVYDYANNGIPLIARYKDGSVQHFNSPLVIITGFSQRDDHFSNPVRDVVHVKQQPDVPAKVFLGYDNFNTLASATMKPVDYRVRYALAPTAPDWATLTQAGTSAPVNVATISVNPSRDVEPGKYLIPVVVTAIDDPYLGGRADNSATHASTIVNVPVVVDEGTNYAKEYDASVADVVVKPGSEVVAAISGVSDVSKIKQINFKNTSYITRADPTKGTFVIKVPSDAPSPSTQDTVIDVVYTDGTKDADIPVKILVGYDNPQGSSLAEQYKDFYLGDKDYFVDEVISQHDQPSIAEFSAMNDKTIKVADVKPMPSDKYFSQRLGVDFASLATEKDVSENLNSMHLNVDPSVVPRPGDYDITSQLHFKDNSSFVDKKVGVVSLFALPFDGQPHVISMKQTDNPIVIPAPSRLPAGSVCSGLSTNPGFVTVGSDCSVTIAPTRSNSDVKKDRSFGVRIARPGMHDRVFTFGLDLTKVTDADVFESNNGGIRPSSLTVYQNDVVDFSKVEGLDSSRHSFKIKNSSHSPGLDLTFLTVNKEGIITARPSTSVKPGVYPFVLEVGFKDGSRSRIDLRVRVNKVSDNKVYNPSFSSPVLEVSQGSTNTSSRLDLPPGATCKLQDKSRSWASVTPDCALKVSPTIENSSTGDFSVNVVVTYKDGSSSIVNEIVRVNPGTISYVAPNNDFSVKAGSTQIFSTDHVNSIARCDILEGPTDFISIDKSNCDLTVSPRLDTPIKQYLVRVAVQTKNGTRVEINQKIDVSKADDSVSFTSGYPSADNQKPVPQGKETILIPPRNIPVGAVCSLGDNAPAYATVDPKTCVVKLSPGYSDQTGVYGVSVVYTFKDGSVKYLTAPYRLVDGPINGRVQPLYSHENTVIQGESLTIPVPVGLSDLNNVVFTKGGTEPTWATVSQDGSIVVAPGIDVKPGHYDIPVVVTYSDSTSDSVKVPVEVGATTDAARHLPQYGSPLVVKQGDTRFEPLQDSTGVVSVELVKDSPSFVTVNPKSGSLSIDPGWEISGPFNVSVIVTYKDGSKRKVNTVVVVKKAPLSERFNDPYGLNDPSLLGKPLASVVQKQTAIVSPISNLPEGTHCVLSEDTPSWVTLEHDKPCNLNISPTLSTASNRTYSVGVTVIYPDSSAVRSDLRVYVKKLADADIYQPSAQPVTVNTGESATTLIVGMPSGSIISGDNLPKWVSINSSGLITFSPGYNVVAKSGEIVFTITYPDGTWNNVKIALTVVRESMATKYSPKYRPLGSDVRVNEEKVVSAPLEVPRDIKAFACDDTPDWAKVNLDGSVVLNPGSTVESGKHFIPVCIIYPDDTKEKSGFSVTVVGGRSSSTHPPHQGGTTSTPATNVEVGGHDINGVSVVNMINERQKLENILGKPGGSSSGSIGKTDDTKTLRPLEGAIFGPPVVASLKPHGTIAPATSLPTQTPIPAPLSAQPVSPTPGQPQQPPTETGSQPVTVVEGAPAAPGLQQPQDFQPRDGLLDAVNSLLGGSQGQAPTASHSVNNKGVVTGDGVKQRNMVEVILAVMLILLSAGGWLVLSYRKKD